MSDIQAMHTMAARGKFQAVWHVLVASVFILLGLAQLPPQGQAAIDTSRLRQAMQAEYGSSGLTLANQWLTLIEQLRGLDVTTQLSRVNDFFNNQVRWLEDADIWGSSDYWATPVETLGRGAGDCEDFSIAKYVTLKELGIPNERLRMIYVRARVGRSAISQAHMVLGYYETPAAEPLILDNLSRSIVRAGQRNDLDPLFSFNDSGLWAGASTQSRADPMARLSRWRSAIDRMRRQGIH
ncbi:transglutaminase-like cysteine peptidase [Halomonas cupida]|uniref:transglutaminase-like cysteine peptidase n=1 Tax=Halomonas cupida TaxID=44933 RepID=UPI003A929B83